MKVTEQPCQGHGQLCSRQYDTSVDQTLSAAQAVTALKKLNVPYLVSLPLVFQTTEEWLDSELGVHPVQVALQVHSQQES